MQAAEQSNEGPDQSRNKSRDGHPIRYFVEGQVAILAEHEAADLAPQQVVELVQREIARLLDASALRSLQASQESIGAREDRYGAGYKAAASGPIAGEHLLRALDDLRINPDREPAPVLTFPRGAQHPPFSLIFVEVRDPNNDALEDDRRLIALFDYLNTRIIADQNQPSDLRLSVVSPNWTAATTQGQFIKGGPGGKPVPADPPIPDPQGIQVDAVGTPFGFRLTTLPEIQGAAADSPVEVAILDTIPALEALEAAYNRWQATHPLIRSLMGPDGTFGFRSKLRLTYARDLGIDFKPLERQPFEQKGYGILDHSYKMSDHGLFAAGIVHTIAPKANLWLIEVLNAQGVGTLDSIARGLLALCGPRTIPLVINCSLMLTIPLLGHPRDKFDWGLFKTDDALRLRYGLEQGAAQTDRDLKQDYTIIKRLGWPLEWICNLLRDQNVLLVAAAGNDAPSNTGVGRRQRPQARYPAAFANVLGVGALLKDGAPATYSNLSDQPLVRGIATFGGGTRGGEAEPGQGVLGIYIGRLPPQTHREEEQPSDTQLQDENETGWAWWSGTSFAAPIISGALAAIIGYGTPPQTALAALRGAQTDLTPDNDEIFTVKQGR